MLNTIEVLSLLFVGACWGCTNPLLKRGASDNTNNNSTTTTSKEEEQQQSSSSSKSSSSLIISLFITLGKFRRISVWLPYLVNQLGSLLFYFTLSNSDLSIAVPVSNALALVFSIITSQILGEKLQQPIQAIAGSILIVSGVAVCFLSENNNIDDGSNNDNNKDETNNIRDEQIISTLKEIKEEL